MNTLKPINLTNDLLCLSCNYKRSANKFKEITFSSLIKEKEMSSGLQPNYFANLKDNEISNNPRVIHTTLVKSIVKLNITTILAKTKPKFKRIS